MEEIDLDVISIIDDEGDRRDETAENHRPGKRRKGQVEGSLMDERNGRRRERRRAGKRRDGEDLGFLVGEKRRRGGGGNDEGRKNEKQKVCRIPRSQGGLIPCEAFSLSLVFEEQTTHV